MKYISKEKVLLKDFEEWKIQKKCTNSDLGKKKNLQRDQADIWKKFTRKTDIKNTLKAHLLSEQGHICCYCQSTIETSIEHFIPRSEDASLMFEYDNLLACCKGGEDERQQIKEFPLYFILWIKKGIKKG
jgi:5-methylcytosine-specific restriction endonuclease McrA